jgi:hypothetical protein
MASVVLRAATTMLGTVWPPTQSGLTTAAYTLRVDGHEARGVLVTMMLRTTALAPLGTRDAAHLGREGARSAQGLP